MLFDQLVESLRNSLAYAEDPTMQESRENALEQIKWARDAGDKKHVAVWQERLRAIETLAAESSSVTVARLVTRNLVLSLFPGADLLGRGFEAAGYTVLRGPDTLLGQDIRSFAWTAHASPEGVAGGSPCQDFSRRRRTAPTGYGRAMLKQFARVVTESQPEWWLLENVPGVPDVVIEGYHVQRFNLFAAECGVKQLRNRRFQFGSRDGLKIVLQRATMSQELLPAALASEDTNRRRRNFADVCELQGLPRSFDLPGLSRSAKFRAVGNGVPVPVAYAVACAIRDRQVTHSLRLCLCDCGRPVTGRQVTATPACRKRMERKRRGESQSQTASQGPDVHGHGNGRVTVLDFGKDHHLHPSASQSSL